MRLIDAEQMALDESEAYMKAQAQIEDVNLLRANLLVHAKLQKLLADAPTVDAVPVVRCRDCKYSVNAKWNKKGYRICPASHMEITDGDFCSYGEHREPVGPMKLKVARRADTVQVIRCADCVHFDPENYGGPTCAESEAMCSPEEDDYCSRGQRKDQSADVRNMEETEE